MHATERNIPIEHLLTACLVSLAPSTDNCLVSVLRQAAWNIHIDAAVLSFQRGANHTLNDAAGRAGLHPPCCSAASRSLQCHGSSRRACAAGGTKRRQVRQHLQAALHCAARLSGARDRQPAGVRCSSVGPVLLLRHVRVVLDVVKISRIGVCAQQAAENLPQHANDAGCSALWLGPSSAV